MGPAQRQSQLADLEAQKKQKEEDEVNHNSSSNQSSFCVIQANVRRSTLMKTMAHLRLQVGIAMD